MELNEIANRGKLINGVIIGINVITFFAYSIGRFADASTGLIMFQSVVRVLGGVIAIAGLVYTAILMNHNDKRLKGFGLLLAACIVTLVFSIIGIMLGIVIWILCGISIRQLDSSFREQSTMNAWDMYADKMTATTYGLNNRQDHSNAPYGAQDPYGAQGGYGAPAQNTYQAPPVDPKYKVPTTGGYGVVEDDFPDFSDLK